VKVLEIREDAKVVDFFKWGQVEALRGRILGDIGIMKKKGNM